MQKTKLDATGEEIRAGVTKTDRLINNKAVYGGLMDPRMGTSDRNERCKTCDCTYSGIVSSSSSSSSSSIVLLVLVLS